jgi:hypothetical protein
MNKITQPPLVEDEDGKVKHCDFSVRSDTTDTTEESIVGSSSSNDESSLSSPPLAGDRLELHLLAEESESPRCRELIGGDKSFEQRYRSASFNSARGVDPSTSCRLQQPVGENGNEQLYFDVTDIVNTLSKDEEVNPKSRWPFSRMRKSPCRSKVSESTEECSVRSSALDDDISVSSLDDSITLLGCESLEHRLHDKRDDDDDFSLSREFNEDDISLSSYCRDRRSATVAPGVQTSSPQLVLDDSDSEDVYYDEPNGTNPENEVKSQSRCNVLTITSPSPSEQDRRHDPAAFQQWEELVERLDQTLTHLEEVRSQTNGGPRANCWLGVTRRRIEANRTQAMLTLRSSQVQRALFFFMCLLEENGSDDSGTIALIPVDIRRTIGMLPELLQI